MVTFGFKTDVGRRREGNEDALLVLPKLGVFAVADGVGGQNSGEIASRKAMGGVEEFLEANPLGGAEGLEGKYRDNWLRGYFSRCFQKVNAEIMALAASEPDYASMATTAVLCYFEPETLYVVNVGDSRAYILREGVLTQLTEDHTYVNDLIRAGTLTRGEARIHPKKNIITRAIGSAKSIEPDFFRFDLHPGDRVLLSTDGLHGEVSDDEIARILALDEAPNELCRLLVKAANEKGGNDNITVVCAENGK
jgi:protein phosphatase